MSLLDKYRQKPTVVAEKGEYFKNPEGEVLKVSPKMPTHDDKYLVTEDTVEKVPSRKGGVVVDAETVVTASRENRPKYSKHYTEEDLALEITGKEAEDFAMNSWGLKVKAKGTISPSKMIDLAMESRDSLLKKYKGKEGIAGSSLSSTTNMANKAVLETLPNLEKIYDDVFDLQESKRIPAEPSQYAQVANIQSYGFKSPTTDRVTLKKKVPTKEELLISQQRVAAANKKIIDDRKRNIAISNQAKNNPNRFSPQNIARETQAIGDKFRIYPNDPNSFIDDYLNPGVMVGDLASGIGKIPKNIQQGNYGQAALNFAMPIAIGALAGMGAKTNTQFVNNLVNPVADILPYRLRPNDLELNTIKGIFKKDDYIPISNTEKQVTRTVRKIGSDIESGILRDPATAVPFLEKLKTRANSLTDEQFSNIAKFEKKDIDNKIKEIQELEIAKKSSDTPTSNASVSERDRLRQMLSAHARNSDNAANESLPATDWLLGRDSRGLAERLAEDSYFNVSSRPVSTELRSATDEDFFSPEELEDINRQRSLGEVDYNEHLTDINDYAEQAIRESRAENEYYNSINNQLSPVMDGFNLDISREFRNHKPFILKGLLNKYSRNMPISDRQIDSSLMPSLFKKTNSDPNADISTAFSNFKNLDKGTTVNAASSLSSDSKLLELQMYNKAVREGLGDINYHGTSYSNQLGFGDKALPPELIKKEIDSYINQLNTVAKTKIPYSKVVNGSLQYPALSVTRKQQGGKTKLTPYPHMKGSRPALSTSDGRSVESVDGRSVSMDQIYDSDSVTVKGNSAKTFYKSKLKKYVK